MLSSAFVLFLFSGIFTASLVVLAVQPESRFLQPATPSDHFPSGLVSLWKSSSGPVLFEAGDRYKSESVLTWGRCGNGVTSIKSPKACHRRNFFMVEHETSHGFNFKRCRLPEYCQEGVLLSEGHGYLTTEEFAHINGSKYYPPAFIVEEFQSGDDWLAVLISTKSDRCLNTELKFGGDAPCLKVLFKSEAGNCNSGGRLNLTLYWRVYTYMTQGPEGFIMNVIDYLENACVLTPDPRTIVAMCEARGPGARKGFLCDRSDVKIPERMSFTNLGTARNPLWANVRELGSRLEWDYQSEILG